MLTAAGQHWFCLVPVSPKTQPQHRVRPTSHSWWRHWQSLNWGHLVLEKYKVLFYGSVISLWFQKALWNSLAQYRGNSENLKQLLSVDNLPSSLCSHFFFVLFLMLWNPEEKPVANAAQFLGWARQEPLRTLYQSLRQNLLTWETQAVMLGRAVKRRSEFETFHKILSGPFVSSLVKLRPSTRLACFIMYPDLPSYSCFWAFACAVPSPGSALPMTGCPSSDSHVSFQKSLPWPQYWRGGPLLLNF